MPADLRQQIGRQRQGKQFVALAKPLPERRGLPLFEQGDALGQAEEATFVADQLEAEAVDGAEERATQVGEERLASRRALVQMLQDQVAGADAQFFRRQLTVGDDHQPGKTVAVGRVPVQGEVGDAMDDGGRLADPRPRRDAEFFVQRFCEGGAGFGVEQGGGRRFHKRRRQQVRQHAKAGALCNPPLSKGTRM